MRLPASLMGCLSSRSTIVPTSERTIGNDSLHKGENNDSVEEAPVDKSSKQSKLNGASDRPETPAKTDSILGETSSTNNHRKMEQNFSIKGTPTNSNDGREIRRDEGAEDDDIISILIDEQNEGLPTQEKRADEGNKTGSRNGLSNRSGHRSKSSGSLQQMGDSLKTDTDAEISDTNRQGNDGEFSVQDEAANIDLLRQYIMVDYEIGLLEDKDALRLYHEKIEQLEQFEQFERELDMIGSDAEEVAIRSDSKGILEDLLVKEDGKIDIFREGKETDELTVKKQTDAGSMLRSMLPQKSWLRKSQPQQQVSSFSKPEKLDEASMQESEKKRDSKGTNDGQQSESTVVSSRRQLGTRQRGKRTNQYTSVEEVFNRKIVLEKQRDKLKKEVEIAIIECDKLQQRYKKRDEILDKLFEGRTGNGLENHLEQQLNWLLEQKHYVDQVYYVWKRAETLTNQTCEQFANALELIKKLPDVEDATERNELVKNIGNLMIKSRQGMEQAQKYNPNVDAPFFTDNETERFDEIIEKISTNSLNQSEYSQILTVVQFAYKRAVSIRLWLEQILQTTIARDSFELAEEYKWIAIQLRKERINLIKTRLETEPYRQMAQELREQMMRQFFEGDISKRPHEINRDSGVGSETKDADLEEEVYRLIEMNKLRFVDGTDNKTNSDKPDSTKQLSGFNSSSGGNQLKSMYVSDLGAKHSVGLDNLLKVNSFGSPEPHFNNNYEGNGKRLREMTDSRGRPLSLDNSAGGVGFFTSDTITDQLNSTQLTEDAPTFDTNGGRLLETPTRLRVELDEKAKLSLLQQVDQIHSNHKKRIERLRGNNKALATSSLMNRLQGTQSAASVNRKTKEMVTNSTPGSI